MEVVKISQPKIDWNKMLTHSEISKCDQCHDLCLPTSQTTNQPPESCRGDAFLSANPRVSTTLDFVENKLKL